MDVSWRSRVCKSEADETVEVPRSKQSATRRSQGTRLAEAVGDAAIPKSRISIAGVVSLCVERNANRKKTLGNTLKILPAP